MTPFFFDSRFFEAFLANLVKMLQTFWIIRDAAAIAAILGVVRALALPITMAAFFIVDLLLLQIKGV